MVNSCWNYYDNLGGNILREKELCNGKSMSISSLPSKNFPFIEKRNEKRQTITFNKPIYVIGRMSVVGEKEGKGPLKDYFNVVIADDKMNEKCFEKAETDILQLAISGAIKNANLTEKEIDCIIGGDLLNQITSSAYVAREYNSVFLGLYSACSTMTESLAIGAMILDSDYFNTVLCSTVSHFATAERQFRYPLEYGCQRPPYAQWTVTGAGSLILSREGKGINITNATIGKVIDFGVSDLNNMGAAMAPAAMNTMLAMFNDTKTAPSDYDLIVTGDLGKLGSDIVRDLMREKGYVLGQNYTDCGCLIYDSTQKCYQGGSGAGCSASVIASFILEKMEKGEYNKVAYLATGALMNSQSCYQGETIPCISHAIIFER